MKRAVNIVCQKNKGAWMQQNFKEVFLKWETENLKSITDFAERHFETAQSMSLRKQAKYINQIAKYEVKLMNERKKSKELDKREQQRNETNYREENEYRENTRQNQS